MMSRNYISNKLNSKKLIKLNKSMKIKIKK